MTTKQKIFASLKILGILWLVSSIVAVIFSIDADFSSGNVGNIAVIPIHGVITTTSASSFSTVVTSEDVLEQLDKANENPRIKAIILDINSPGGSGVAADEISQKIKSINKPTVAVIRDLGASAAYWISSATDHIYANRLSITGSIGVTGSYLEFSGLFTEYNISYQRYVSGALKDMGSPFKEPSELEEEIFQKLIDDMQTIFLDEVAQNRNLSKTETAKFGSGQIYLGIEAKELGLVDSLGTRDDALVYLENELNITAVPIEFKKKISFSELLSKMSSLLTPKIGKFINFPNINFI